MASLVLVAEDDPTNQKLLHAMLVKCGHTPVIVGDGDECLTYLAAGHDPALLLLDLMMPKVDGLQVLRHLKAEGLIETLPTVVLSAKNEQQVIKEALSLGAWDYILKPFQPKNFIQRVGDLIFAIDEAALQSMLQDLRYPEKKILGTGGLHRHSPQTSQAYLATDRGRPVCVIVPFGQAPQALAKLPLSALEQQVWIYRKCAIGWRKLWPRWPVS